MKWIKLFEDFKENNEEGSLITQDDIIKCIKNRGKIYATIVNDFPKNNPKKPLTPIDVDSDGLVSVKIGSKIKGVNIKNIERIEY
jgi:hypothetical protein